VLLRLLFLPGVVAEAAKLMSKAETSDGIQRLCWTAALRDSVRGVRLVRLGGLIDHTGHRYACGLRELGGLACHAADHIAHGTLLVRQEKTGSVRSAVVTYSLVPVAPCAVSILQVWARAHSGPAPFQAFNF
jgi:hypothetical protein